MLALFSRFAVAGLSFFPAALAVASRSCTRSRVRHSGRRGASEVAVLVAVLVLSSRAQASGGREPRSRGVVLHAAWLFVPRARGIR